MAECKDAMTKDHVAGGPSGGFAVKVLLVNTVPKSRRRWFKSNSTAMQVQILPRSIKPIITMSKSRFLYQLLVIQLRLADYTFHVKRCKQLGIGQKPT